MLGLGLAKKPDKSATLQFLDREVWRSYGRKSTVTLRPIDLIQAMCWSLSLPARLALTDTNILDLALKFSWSVPLAVMDGSDFATLLPGDLTGIGMRPTTASSRPELSRNTSSRLVLASDQYAFSRTRSKALRVVVRCRRTREFIIHQELLNVCSDATGELTCFTDSQFMYFSPQNLLVKVGFCSPCLSPIRRPRNLGVFWIVCILSPREMI